MPARPERSQERLREQVRLGQRIREARQAAGLTQVALGKTVGFSSTGTMSAIEKGRQGIDALDLRELARATEHPIEFFLDHERWEARREGDHRPCSLVEWMQLSGGDERWAEAHWSLDRAMAR